MHRNDKSKFLLYIEPSREEKLKEPINDKLTYLMKLALSKAKSGSADYSDPNSNGEFTEGPGWRGWHGTYCGKTSDNHDYLLENGLITNSLCVFYVMWYRNSIHENDWMKIKSLADFYGVDIEMPDEFIESPSSTIKESYETRIKRFEDMIVDELSKSINEEIINKLKKIK